MWDYLMYMGYGARDIIVAGDSAGGNLALELCLKTQGPGPGPAQRAVAVQPLDRHDGQRQELPHLPGPWTPC